MSDVNRWAVRLNCPHATRPEVLWRVLVTGQTAAATEESGHVLWVPTLDTWTLETLRMVLHELSAFLPPHDEATVIIKARRRRAGGRPPRVPRPAQVEQAVFTVSARGWTAHVWTWIDEKDRARVASAGEWSEPMAAALLELATRSPFPLASVHRVLAADDPGLLPSRLRHRLRLTRFEPEFETDLADRRDETADLRDALDRLRQGIQRSRDGHAGCDGRSLEELYARLSPEKRVAFEKLLRAALEADDDDREED